MTVTVGLMLGQPPSSASVIPEVIDALGRAGARVCTWVTSNGAEPPEALWTASVVGLRQLDRPGLAVARRLETAGARCCNPVDATRAASDKAVVAATLAAAGVPVPAGVVLPSWSDARRAAALGPSVVKAVDGRGGTGVLLVEGDGLPASAPFAGPYIVQERLPHQGPDRKVFVIGSQLWGVLRPWPPAALADKLGQPFDPGPEERAVATRAGAALGLDVYGVDLVPTERGPVVVDVNPFPGFKGAHGAGAALATHLLALADAAETG